MINIVRMLWQALNGLIKIALICLVAFMVVMYFNLDVGTNPQKADVIIVPEGQILRGMKAVKLLNQDYARSHKIIVSPLNRASGTLKQTYHDIGASQDSIVAEPNATSTWTNATQTIKLMKEQGWKSALVVTSDFHTRRTKLAFDRAAQGTDMTFTIVSAYANHEGQEVKYYQDGENLKLSVQEIFKLVGYYLYLYEWVDI